MKIDAVKILKTASRAGFYVISRAVGFCILGFFINMILLVLLWPEMGILGSKVGNMHYDAAGGGGPLVILFFFALIIAYWPITLIVVLFGIVFPALYFIFGKKHGVQKAIQHIVNDNRGFIMEYTVERLFDHVKKGTGIGDRVDTALSKAQLLNYLPVYLNKLDNMPRPMRAVFRMIIKRSGLGKVLTSIINETKGDDDTAITFDMIVAPLKEKTGTYIEEKLFAPNLKWFAILGVVNLAIFIVLKVTI